MRQLTLYFQFTTQVLVLCKVSRLSLFRSLPSHSIGKAFPLSNALRFSFLALDSYPFAFGYPSPAVVVSYPQVFLKVAPGIFQAILHSGL